ncbi:MAG: hypothetical protein JOY92_13110 [Verrucomicrobia bacterium]|nr:hypothetical protein [Verrucomicrobiota bacterium]
MSQPLPGFAQAGAPVQGVRGRRGPPGARAETRGIPPGGFEVILDAFKGVIIMANGNQACQLRRFLIVSSKAAPPTDKSWKM